MSPLKFTTEKSLGGWDIYTVPSGGWNYRILQIAFGIFISLAVSMVIAWYVFSWMTKYSEVLQDKVELESKYILDRFTNIYSREYFNFRVKEEVSSSLRNERPISMIYFDLDHFKYVNDNYGHSTGDEVLLEVVKQVKTIIRAEEVFARWGGDEFILLLPNTKLEGAEHVAERIRREIESLDISKAYDVTASLGYSEWKTKEYIESERIRPYTHLKIQARTKSQRVIIIRKKIYL